MGGIVERAEPDRATGRSIDGRLRAGENFVNGGEGRLQLRGGSREALILTESSVSDLVGISRWSPTSALLVAHSATNSKHYAYGLNEDGSLALPVGAATESGSRVDLGWNTAAPHWPQMAELFETLFVFDTEAATRQALKAIKLTGGALVATTVEADLNGDTTAAAMKPAGGFVYGSVLFAYGWEDETVGASPHILRHSFLGQDPSESAGWDPDAYAVIGSQGEPIRAGCPGQDIALVAKYAELFRVFGSPDADAGWQFSIQPVNSDLRLGAVNPQALCYAADRWWGIGRDGPWAFDGTKGASLVPSRRASWGRVGDLAAAFVAPHPRRAAVLFGFPEPASLVSGTRASRLWVFDTESDRWAPDFTTPSRFYSIAAVAQTGVALDTIPDALTWLTDDPYLEATALSFDFTSGDLTALTEVWAQPAGGSYALKATVPAGVESVRLSGLARGTVYTVKIRHRQGDALTEFGDEVVACTEVDAPRVISVSGQSIDVIIPGADQSLTYQTIDSYLGANVAGTVEHLAAGVYSLDLERDHVGSPAGITPHLTVWLGLLNGAYASRPLTVRDAQYLTNVSAVPANVAVSQQFSAEALAETTLDVLVSVRVAADIAVYGGTVALDYRVFGSGGAFTTATEVPFTTTLLATITGLTANTRYEVRARVVSSSLGLLATCDSVVMFTALTAPTATIATAGAGTPVTNITVTPPAGLPGFDTLIRSSGGAYESLYSGVATTPTTYQSTVGVCGRADRYWVRARHTAWPDGFQYSPPVELAIVNPCVIG